MGKQRRARFRDAYAVVRIDGFHSPETTSEHIVSVKEVWLSEEQADREVERLNALWHERHGNHEVRYFSQHTRVERDLTD